ncbi:MAG: long-chain-fatty-acid--CoA ligase, partial [Solirubrobacteraceae bacterium]
MGEALEDRGEDFSIVDVLRERAATDPDHPALVCEGASETYAELDRRSSRLANYLLAAGVGDGDRIAHLDRNHPASPELLFAAAKIGAVLVPLNWRLAAPELVTLLDDAQVSILFCGAQFEDVAKEIAEKVQGLREPVVIDGERPSLEDCSDEDPRSEGGRDAVVLQLYTSGTTGKPKGVMTSNRNFVGLISALGEMWSVDDSSVSLVAMPLFHIGGMGWLLVGLTSGAVNVLVPEIEPASLLETLERERITNAFLVPTVLQMLAGVPGAADRDWSQLRSIAYGASSITTTTLKAVLQTFGCPLYQVYGMTETTGAIVQLAADDHDPDGPRAHLLRSAGKPYPWMELRVVDPTSGEPLAATEVGEVRVRGASVTPGYFANESETATAIDEDGWLHTGDGGYLDEEGYLFLTDRIKDMIVSGAENVYPAEVEEALAQHPEIAEVAVFGVPDERWGETVTAAVVLKSEADEDPDQLIAFARERLAGYKLPRRVLFVDELPKTATGKVSKQD